MTAPETVIVADRIYTGESEGSWVEAVAVAGGIVTATGRRRDLLAKAGPSTRVVDGSGLCGMPGLVDGHVHLGMGGRSQHELQLSRSDDIPQVLRAVEEHAPRLGPEEWIVGNGLGAAFHRVTAEDMRALEIAAGGRPVLLREASFHNRWVSRRVLAAMGVRDGEGRDDGFGRDVDGALNGRLYEDACTGAEVALTAANGSDELRQDMWLTSALRVIASYGITSVQDAATVDYIWNSLSRIQARGDLSARVVGSMPVRPFVEDGMHGEELCRAAERVRGPLLSPDFVKIVMDGVPDTHTSAMLHPYSCHPGAHPGLVGEAYWSRQELAETLIDVAGRGYGAKIHATGDASARLVLDAVADARRVVGPEPIFQIAHAMFVAPDDVARLGELGVVADASPFLWESHRVPRFAEIVGPATGNCWAFRDIVDSGGLVAAGSDWPAVFASPDPWGALESLVTRQRIGGDHDGGAAASGLQRLTVDEAVAACTRNPARAMGKGTECGRLLPGMSADLILVDQDVYRVSPTAIHATTVQATWFAGREVFSRG